MRKIQPKICPFTTLWMGYPGAHFCLRIYSGNPEYDFRQKPKICCKCPMKFGNLYIASCFLSFLYINKENWKYLRFINLPISDLTVLRTPEMICKLFELPVSFVHKF